MSRIPHYERCIGSASPSELFFDPLFVLPEYWAGRGRWQPGQAMHTFVDDYRQEFFWRRPSEGLICALSATVCTAPDYTSWTDDPAEFRSYQAWRCATVAAFWQRAGVNVLPVVQFGTGIERYVRPGSAWAVRGSLQPGWQANLVDFVQSSGCASLVVFGRAVPSIDGLLMRNVRLNSSKVSAAQKEGQGHGR